MSSASPTVATLKAEGVELFKQRRYKEAAKKFTLAIDLDEAGCDELKAQCHNNRAAAREHAGGASRPALIADMTEAIRLKPDYGKAYVRRQRYHKESGQWREALADLNAVLHLGVLDLDAVEEQIVDCVKRITDQRIEQRMDELRAHNGETTVPVPHSRIDRIMSCFVRDDGLLKDVRAYKNGGMRGEGMYSEALKLFAEKKYDDIDTFIMKRRLDVGERAAECWLLATLILFLKGKHTEAVKMYATPTALMNALPYGDRRTSLKIASNIICYQTAETAAQIMEKWRHASSHFPSSPDVYTQAFARLCEVKAFTQALTVINDPRVDSCDLIKHLREIAPLFTGSVANPLAKARRCEEMLRAGGLPTYATSMLASAYWSMGRSEEARSLARHLAERDNEAELWFTLSVYYTRGRPGDLPHEREEAVRRCLAIDPMHNLANGAMAAARDQAFDEQRPIRVSKREAQLTLQYAENCLRTYVMASVPEMVTFTMHAHERAKAQLRAAEMLGVQ